MRLASRVRLLALLPVLLLFLYIARFGLDIPFWDQWHVIPLLVKFRAGGLALADLLAQHNEHRPFFPRLLWLMLARATGYNTNAELWLNWGLALLTATAFAFHTRAVYRHYGLSAFGVFVPLLALLVFNLAQWESWLFGIQTIMFLGMLAVVAGFIVLARWEGWRGLLCGAALGVIATFSMANAVLYWPLGLLILLIDPRQRWRRAAVWSVCAAGALTLFFNDWSPTTQASLTIVWQQPGRYALWVLNFLGAPLLTYWYAWVFGLASLAGAAVMAKRVLHSERLQPLAPYLALLLFILLSALAVAVGRASLSATSAVASRYLTQTVWYWASLLALLPLARLRLRWVRFIHIGLAFMLCVNMVGGALLGYYWRYQRTLPAYEALRSGAAVADSELESISGLPATLVRERLETLCQYQWSVCRK